jgi:pyruvate dehydrogenase E2 component (dihydrolipoamide acetyltransferase)
VSINIGLAVDTPEGLYVPVMNDIANRSDEDLRSQINRFKDYATHRSFPAAELKGATILVTNFGTFAGRYANPVLVPPLVSIIGIGKARIEPTVIANEIKPCKILPLSVTADHRAVTGGELSRFLATLIENLRP